MYCLLLAIFGMFSFSRTLYPNVCVHSLLKLPFVCSIFSSCPLLQNMVPYIPSFRGNVDRALELYDKAVQFSRTQLEMGQALVAREVISAQFQVCSEYGVSMKELASRAAMNTAMH